LAIVGVMRRSEFAMADDEALAFLQSQVGFHLASTTADGAPLLRTLHGVVVDGYLAFHSAPKGEKTGALGRSAVAVAEEIVAVVPSTFFDPVRACPATTYYRSVAVHGAVEEIADPSVKARVLQALMAALQPTGGYHPITHSDPLYRATVNGILVAGIKLDDVHGKAKLAQNRKPAEITALLTSLWRRGDDGDVRAIELIRAANPTAALPEFLHAPDGITIHPWLPATAADDAAALLAGSYWNTDYTAHQIARAHRGSAGWIGARDRSGRLIASARVLADGGKLAWIYDVIVAPSHRGLGIGHALLRVLLDHPMVRSVGRVMLGTRDAQSLYSQFGFVDRAELPSRGFTTTDMVLLRTGSATNVALSAVSDP
jgi:nitroimidazol reductase NimA-like FMN-containing flavoprotein (pyridoxamine 5'-phosphate oxidase superfamily)/ribosomal protein S18 acetylase RimI-like enzyme